MRCGHVHRSWRYWEVAEHDWQPLFQVCDDCGDEWIAIGPARDDGEHKQRVAMELRAAQLANTPKGAYVRNGEAAGWDAHVTGDDVPWDGSEESCHWHAGYLARAIATHTEET